MNYLDNTPLDQAVKVYRARLAEQPWKQTEKIPVIHSLNRVLSEAVYARRSSPHYTASAMDGIAINSDKTAFASENNPVILKEKLDYQRVDTGDPLPDNCDAVMMAEDLIDAGPQQIRILNGVASWENIRQIGEDICESEMICPSGERVIPAVIGALLAGGVQQVTVYNRPVITLIPTGDEIISSDLDPDRGQINDFNSPMFAALLEQNGYIVRIEPIVPDQPDLLGKVLRNAAEGSDGVLVIAGSSAGRDDYTVREIRSAGETVFHGLAIRPGKPAILGIVSGKPVIGLPGYPVSGLMVMEKVVLPVFSSHFNLPFYQRQRLEAMISRRIVSSLKYEEYVRVRMGRVQGVLTAVPLDRGAGVVTSFMKADGLLTIPINREGVEAGETVGVELLKPLQEIENSLLITGSHDPLIDEMADLFRIRRCRYQIKSAHVGSMAGILSVRQNETHLAGIHLIDENTGLYNIPLLKKYSDNKGILLIRGVVRVQGLMIKKGSSIRSLIDLAGSGLRYVNRQKGSGTRILLDLLLKKLGVHPQEIRDYHRVEITHLGVAAAIAEGKGDAGLGIYSAAKAYGLDFIPVCDENYDFILPASLESDPMIREFKEVLQSPQFSERLDKMGGYRLENTGEVIRIEPEDLP